MPRPYRHPDIRIHYQTLITRGFECICDHTLQRACITRNNIDLLLQILSLREKTDEFITMESNLQQMRESLSLLLALPRTTRSDNLN